MELFNMGENIPTRYLMPVNKNINKKEIASF